MFARGGDARRGDKGFEQAGYSVARKAHRAAADARKAGHQLDEVGVLDAGGFDRQLERRIENETAARARYAPIASRAPAWIASHAACGVSEFTAEKPIASLTATPTAQGIARVVSSTIVRSPVTSTTGTP